MRLLFLHYFIINSAVMLLKSLVLTKFMRRDIMGLSRQFSSTKGEILVGYTTDLEGDLNYWHKYIENSKVLFRDSVNNTLHLKENSIFVFGGDICDRGPGDIRILQDLVHLKERYPNRTYFILGNRDINKLRLPFSLHPCVLEQGQPHVYWLRNEQDRTRARDAVASGAAESKLKWLLSHTMGAPLSFEYRRKELQDMGSPYDDAAVANSYLDLLTTSPKGLLTKYLKYAQISLVLGDVMFVHGAVHDYNAGWLPPNNGSANGDNEDNCRKWSSRINDFKNREMDEYINNSADYLKNMHIDKREEEFLWEIEGGYRHGQPGSRLLQYGMGWMPDKSINPSVIYSSYLRAGQAIEIGAKASSWLSKGGVKRVVVGHQPNGDAPWIHSKHNIQVISADTGYSKNTQWPRSYLQRKDVTSEREEGHYISAADYQREINGSPVHVEKLHSTRSDEAYTEVLLPIPSSIDDEGISRSNAQIHGRLSDGSDYTYELLPVEDDKLTGRKVCNDWVIKVPNTGFKKAKKNIHLVSHSEGYTFRNKFIDASFLEDR